MPLTGAIVNAVVVLICSFFGMFLRRGFPKRFRDILVGALGAVTLCLGIQAFLETKWILVVILSLVVGSLIGEWIDLEKRLEQAGEALQSSFKGQDKIAEGFVTSTLLFCVGSMAIMGAIRSGTRNDHTLLFTKSLLDGVMSIVFGSIYGLGVAFSALVVLLYEGGLTLLADVLSAGLDPAVLVEISATGGILLILLGINMLNLREEKFKIANMLPSLLLPLLMQLFIK
jgi:uncharacterized membrane protein YqgA involved in biofilm formation